MDLCLSQCKHGDSMLPYHNNVINTVTFMLDNVFCSFQMAIDTEDVIILTCHGVVVSFVPNLDPGPAITPGSSGPTVQVVLQCWCHALYSLYK